MYNNLSADASTKSESKLITSEMMKMFSFGNFTLNFGNITEELQITYKSIKIGGMSAPKIITGTLDVIDSVKGHKAYQKFKDLISNKDLNKKAEAWEKSWEAFRDKKGEELKSVVDERGHRRKITYNDLAGDELDDVLKKGHEYSEMAEPRANKIASKNKAMQIEVLPQVEKSFSQKFSVMKENNFGGKSEIKNPSNKIQLRNPSNKEGIKPLQSNFGGILDDLDKFEKNKIMEVLESVEVDKKGKLIKKESFIKKVKNDAKGIVKKIIKTENNPAEIFKAMQKIETTKPGSINQLKQALTDSWREVAVRSPNLPGIIGEGITPSASYNPSEIFKEAKDGVINKIKTDNANKVIGPVKKLKIYSKFKSQINKLTQFISKHMKVFGSILIGFEAVGIASSAYEIASGVKNLQGSGTITDILERTAMNLDLATYQTLGLYEEISGNVIEEMDFEMKNYLLTGLELHTCNKVRTKFCTDRSSGS